MGADVAQKSHQYVRSSGGACSMLRCRVCLGNPYLIEGNLLSGSIMHDLCWCRDPSEFLESVAEDWSVKRPRLFLCEGPGGQAKGRPRGLQQRVHRFPALSDSSPLPGGLRGQLSVLCHGPMCTA